MNPQARVAQRAPSNHNRTTKPCSKPTESSPSMAKPPPNPRPQSNFPGVAFSPAPRRPPRSAFKRLLSRSLRKLKKYLDKKAVKYNADQQSRRPTRASRPRPGRPTNQGNRQHQTSNNGNGKTARVISPPRTQQRFRPSSGALPLLRQDASTTSLDAKGPFSASQKRELHQKLTTIRESSAEAEENGAGSASSRTLPIVPYNDVDAASDPLNHGPTTPIPEPAEPSEHFPNLTCRRCNVDWARADRRALNDFILLRNTEAMRAVSRDASMILRAEGGWIQRRDTFDDSAWREGSKRNSLTAILNVKRWYRHQRNTSAHSVPSLSSSQSSLGSIIESFPTPANATQPLCDDYSIGHRLNYLPSRMNDSIITTPVITISEWDENDSIHDTASNPYPGASGIPSTGLLAADDQLGATYPLRPPKPIARLRGKQPWYLNEFSSPFNSASFPLLQSLPVPIQSVDFFTEKPLMIPAHDPSLTGA